MLKMHFSPTQLLVVCWQSILLGTSYLSINDAISKAVYPQLAAS
jgi:hypothetical protein